MKTCTECGAARERSEYWRLPGSPDGLESRCRLCRNAAQRRRRAENREELRERDRRNIEANRDRINERDRRYRAAHRESTRESRQRWCDGNPDRVRANVAASRCRRRAALRGAVVVDHCPQVAAIYEIAAWLRNQGDDVHVDHVEPLCRGGTHAIGNLRILPADENRAKHAAPPPDLEAWRSFQAEWRGRLAFLGPSSREQHRREREGGDANSQ